MTETEYRQLAKDLHHEEGALEIDDAAKVSEAEDKSGAYVQAWVWVDATDVEDEDEDEKFEFCECGRDFEACATRDNPEGDCKDR